MTSIKHWLAIPILVAVTLLSGYGQALPAWLAKHPDGAPPEIGVLDDARFLARNPEAIDRINAGIVKLRDDHGYRIHLVIVSTLIGTTALEQANELRRIWLPDENGLVIVFESDNRNFGIGQNMDGNPLDVVKDDTVPSYETTAIISRALAGADSTHSTEAYLESAVGGMVTGFDQYFISRRTAPSSQRSVRIALLATGAVSVLGLGAIAVGGLIRHSRMTRGLRFRFPVADTRERLGATCGASVTARRFAPSREH